MLRIITHLWALKMFLCRHQTVAVFRAHQASDFAKLHIASTAWIDRLECRNFLRCAHCGTVLKPHRNSERVYEEVPPSVPKV